MKFRRILGLSMAIAIAASMVAVSTVTFASPGHDDGAKQTTKKQNPKKKATKPAAVNSAQAGTLGTLEAPRDIEVTMTDALRFDPGTIVVSEGETIRFLLSNPTAAPHDFLIGDLEEQLHHHDEMAVGKGHDDNAAAGVEGGLPDAVTLEPGESAEVIATFDEAGALVIGCHVPGHWEAGMRGDIAVLAPDLQLGTVDAPRDIAVSMTDELRFDPGTIVISEGETVRFLLNNPTAAPHDFLIGDLEEQLHHHEEMAAGGGHEETTEDETAGGLPPAVTLEPGESTEVIATFGEVKELMIGCHVPGHWEAGMRGNIAMVPADQVVLAVARVTQA